MLARRDRDRAGKAFEISRTFDARSDLVWRAWSERDRLEQWWGPQGCAVKVARLEFRPGGFFHYAMEFANETPMWGRFMYREITAPRRIVWLNSFSNETCGITRAPFSQDCPLEIENTVTFSEQNGKTVIVLRALPHGASEQECDYFDSIFTSLAQGYGGTLDQLASHLASASKC
jgi:uncharacterized protein YndB with AHSA1/START domain